MQTLLTAVRATGATNVVTLSANGWGGDIPQWLNYRPHDPAGQIAAGWHVYFPETFYSDPSRWASSVLPVAAQVPIATTELGEHDCADGWMNQFLPWADQHGLSYTAWTWNAWPDCSNPVLITKYDGSATGYGAGYRDHLRALNGFKPVATQALSGPANARGAAPARTPASAAAGAHSPAASAHPAGTTAATIAQRRSGTTVAFAAQSSALTSNPGRALLIWVGSLALLAAPLGFTGTRWYIRRRRRRRAATEATAADRPVSPVAAKPSQT